MSLLTVAAIAASVVINKTRQPRPTEDLRSEAVEGSISLEAIRQAGF